MLRLILLSYEINFAMSFIIKKNQQSSAGNPYELDLNFASLNLFRIMKSIWSTKSTLSWPYSPQTSSSSISGSVSTFFMTSLGSYFSSNVVLFGNVFETNGIKSLLHFFHPAPMSFDKSNSFFNTNFSCSYSRWAIESFQ